MNYLSAGELAEMRRRNVAVLSLRALEPRGDKGDYFLFRDVENKPARLVQVENAYTGDAKVVAQRDLPMLKEPVGTVTFFDYHDAERVTPASVKALLRELR